MRKNILFILMLFTLVSSISAQSGEKVLLAMEKTAFKKALIAEMEKSLNAKGLHVTVVEDHKKDLENYKASDYDYVFITNSGVGSKVRPWVKDWLESNNNSSNILLHTTKIKKWNEKVSVDAVSSASSKKDASSLAEEYIKLLLGR